MTCDFKNENLWLMKGDCLERMKEIPDNSISLVLVDPPYEVSAMWWDKLFHWESVWKEINRVCKTTTPKVFTATQPFTTKLINTNIENFKYSWVWEKNFSTNFLHAKRQPLRKHEDIVVFYNKTGQYYPQKTTGHKPTQSAIGSSIGNLWHGDNNRNYKGGETTRYPTSIIKINAVDPKQRLHPSQKPVPLMEYLIKTYTNKGETVLDFCLGSGTTGVACVNLNRKFIGIEMDDNYFEIAKDRVLEAVKEKSDESTC